MKSRPCVISDVATAGIWQGEWRIEETGLKRGHAMWPLFSANVERLLVNTLEDRGKEISRR